MTDYKLDPPEAPRLTAESMAAPHPGQMIRDQLKERGYTVVAAAAAMAVNRPNLHSMLTGKTALTSDMAYRLSALINPDDDDFHFAKLIIDMQAAHDWHVGRAKRMLVMTLVTASRKSVEAVGQ